MDPHATETLGHFSERNGANTAAYIEALFESPETPLSPEEAKRVTAFAHQLFEGRYGELRADVGRNLEAIQKAGVLQYRQTFYLDYFFTEQGRQDIAALEISQPVTREELRQHLLDVETITAQVDAKKRKEIAVRSEDWYTDVLATRLAEPAEEDGDFEEAKQVSVQYKPEALFDKLDDLQKYRTLYRQILGQLRRAEDTSAEHQAQIALTQMHLGRVNAMLADSYPDLIAIAAQLKESWPSEQTAHWRSRLQAILPVLDRIYQREDEAAIEEFMQTFARRLDFVRNGVGRQDTSEGTALTSILPEIDTLVAQTEQPPAEFAARLPAEVVERLDDIEWDAQQMKTFSETVLREWGLLSEEAIDWAEASKRSGFAPDEKFQVVIAPKKSFSVNTTQRIVYVPQNFLRTLTAQSPAGALPVAAHELAHALQGLVDYELGEAIPLAKIKGRRYLTVREAGGLYQEKIIQNAYFGRDRAINKQYVEALKTKLEGGSKLQTIRAFYDSYVAAYPPQDGKAAAAARELAANRALRLYRNKGYNSQPLDYVEQGLIVQQLQQVSEEQAAAFVIAGGSFNLQDSATLHKFGLLHLPSQAPEPAHDVMRIFLEQFDRQEAS